MTVELGKGDNVPFGGFGSRWSTGGAIHSGRDEEVWERRSPSFSRSLNQRSVMDDGRQSSGATSLTGILAEGERRFYGSFWLEGVLRLKKR